MLVLVPAVCLAQSAPAIRLKPAWVKKYAQLEAKAKQQQGHQRAETLAALAALDYQVVNSGFNHHDVAAADHYMEHMSRHADQACALLHTEAQQGKKDGIKHVEVIVQRIAFGLRGLESAVDFREEAKIEAAVEHFTNLNYELLQWLFAPKS
ncbi:MAG: hypothetical protein ACRD1F_10925 [Terriglobales bacterium]